MRLLISLVAVFSLCAIAQAQTFDDYDPLFPVGCGSNSNPNASGCSNFGTSLYTFLSGESAAERTEYGAKNFVVSGCLGGTAAGLSHTPSSCTAYNKNIRGTETGPITYPNNSTCWVAMDENRTGSNAGLPNFARVAGEHYLTDCTDVGQPTMAADSQLLMKVTTSGGAITGVIDLRNTTAPFTAVGGGAASPGGGTGAVQVNGGGNTFGPFGGSTLGAHNFANAINGNGVLAGAQPADADLALSDVTTNNVSTAAHGFAPKLPNDSTKFLNGVGAYSVPPSSGDTIATYTGPSPLQTSGGGTGCHQTNPMLFNNLPASPVLNTTCTITDATNCLDGNIVTSGGGSMICPLGWNGSNWEAMGAGLDAGTGLILPNTVTGTVRNALASTAGAGQIQITTAGATSGVQGICDQNCTNSGNAVIQTIGVHGCIFSGGITYGHYAQVDPTTNGDCVDGGATYPTTGGEVMGTIVSASNVNPGTYNVNLFGPDVANVAGTGGGGVNSGGVAGNPAIYAGSNSVSPVANVISCAPGDLHNCLAQCPTNAGCTMWTRPGQTYTINSPLELGGPHQVNSSNAQRPQTLINDNATVNCGDTTAGNVDDCIVLGTAGKLFCTGNGDATIGGIIQTTNTAVLNSVVGSLGGLILNSWQSAHVYKVGQFIFDGTNTEQVKACSGSCTSGGVAPSWPSANSWGTTTTDNAGANQVTWTFFANGRAGAGGGQEWYVNGCHINGSTSASASINSVIHISGVSGGFAVLKDVTYGGISGTGHDSINYAGNGTGLLIDDGQTNAFCTGSGAPLACCTGSGTGTCQSGSGGSQSVLVENEFLGPGNAGAVGPSYGVHVTGNNTWNTKFIGGQIADIVGTGNTALFEADNANNISIDDVYFEIGDGTNSEGGSDALVFNNVGDIEVKNMRLGPNTNPNSPLLTNCIHIKGSLSGMTRAQITGRVVGNSSCTNVLTNDPDPTASILGNSNQSLDYHYGGTSATPIWSFQNPVTFQAKGLISKLVTGLTTGVSISGGGSLATGSNSVAGTVTSAAATGNVLTPGFTCPNKVVLALSDETTLGGAKVTASTTTTATFSATASDTVDYIASCR